MLQVLKILTGKDEVDNEHWFKMAAGALVRTRQATGLMNVVEPRARLDGRANFFSNRSVDDWNEVQKTYKLRHHWVSSNS